jgi:hypothetical protein
LNSPKFIQIRDSCNTVEFIKTTITAAVSYAVAPATTVAPSLQIAGAISTDVVIKDIATATAKILLLFSDLGPSICALFFGSISIFYTIFLFFYDSESDSCYCLVQRNSFFYQQRLKNNRAFSSA